MKKTTKKVSKVKPVPEGVIVRQFKAANGSKWNIIRSIVTEPFGEKTSKEYYVQIVSRNSNKLTVGRGLNTCQSAIKNMNAVIAATKGIREVKLKK